MIRRVLLIFTLILLLCSLLFTPIFSAETEPNDSFSSAQEIEDGIYYGSVSSPGLGNDEDDDYYLIMVPSGWDLRVTLECTGPDYGSQVNIRQYDENRLIETDDDAIDMDIVSGDSETMEWYNADTSDQDVYLFLTGDGDYTLTIETEEFLDPWIAIAICMIFILVILVVIIVIIVVILKKKKRRQLDYQYPAQSPGQQQYPQYQYQQQYPRQEPYYHQPSPPRQPQYPQYSQYQYRSPPQPPMGEPVPEYEQYPPPPPAGRFGSGGEVQQRYPQYRRKRPPYPPSEPQYGLELDER